MSSLVSAIHRFAQEIRSEAMAIAFEYDKEKRREYIEAARQIRVPYWDWAGESTAKSGRFSRLSPKRRFLPAPHRLHCSTLLPQLYRGCLTDLSKNRKMATYKPPPSFSSISREFLLPVAVLCMPSCNYLRLCSQMREIFAVWEVENRC